MGDRAANAAAHQDPEVGLLPARAYSEGRDLEDITTLDLAPTTIAACPSPRSAEHCRGVEEVLEQRAAAVLVPMTAHLITTISRGLYKPQCAVDYSVGWGRAEKTTPRALTGRGAV